MENCFPLKTQKSETLNQLLLFSLVSFVHLCFYSPLLFFPLLGLYTGINYLNFLLSWSCKSPVITKRGIRLQRNLPTGNCHYLPKQSRSFVPCSLKHVQPTVTVLFSHSALGMRHLLGFHLLPLSLKSSLSLIQTKPSYSLLLTATNLNLRKAEKFFYWYYFLAGCLQGGPGVFTSPGDMLLFKHSQVCHVLARDICTNIPPRGWARLWIHAAPSCLAVLLLAVIAVGLLISF